MVAQRMDAALRKKTKIIARCERERLRIAFHREPAVAANHRAKAGLRPPLDAKSPGRAQFQPPVHHAFNTHRGEQVGNWVHVGSSNWTNGQQFWTIGGRASRILDIDTSMAGPIHKLFGATLLSILAFSLTSPAAELAPDTLRAWSEYIRAENAKVSRRSPGKPFLWIDESPGRRRRVHDGEILIAPAAKNVPQ